MEQGIYRMSERQGKGRTTGQRNQRRENTAETQRVADVCEQKLNTRRDCEKNPIHQSQNHVEPELDHLEQLQDLM